MDHVIQYYSIYVIFYSFHFVHYIHLFITYFLFNILQCKKYSETTVSNSNVNYLWPIKYFSEVIKKLWLRNCQGSQVSSFDFFINFIHLMIYLCYNRESNTFLCSSDKAQFEATRNITRVNGYTGKGATCVKHALFKMHVKRTFNAW